jgi:hypothetical protein
MQVPILEILGEVEAEHMAQCQCPVQCKMLRKLILRYSTSLSWQPGWACIFLNERYGLIAEITGQQFRRDAKKSSSDGRGVSVASGADSRELENLSRSRYKLYFRFSTP